MLPYTKYYKMKTGERADMCKDCLCRNIDIRKPETYLWIMKTYNIPYDEKVWIDSICSVYRKSPKKDINPRSVFGIYYRLMLTPGFRPYSWEDSSRLHYLRGDIVDLTPEEEANIQKVNAELKRQLDAGEISEAEYLTKYCRTSEDNRNSEDEIVDTLGDRIDEALAKEDAKELKRKSIKEAVNETDKMQDLLEMMSTMVRAETGKQKLDYLRDNRNTKVARAREQEAADVLGQQYAEEAEEALADESQETGSVPQSDTSVEQERQQAVIDSINSPMLQREKRYAEELSEDEKTALAIKWGDNYSLSDWVRMEKMYREYEDSYDMNVDRKEALKMICKTSLKLDQALDSEDMTAAKNLSMMLDTLRKSAKFTDAQNKEDKQRDIDCVGELVAAVEKEGGIIEQFDLECNPAQDKIDLILKDTQAYVYNLVKNDLGLGDQIEAYVQKLDEAQRIREEEEADLTAGLITSADEQAEEEQKNAEAAAKYAEELEETVRRETAALFGEDDSEWL